MTRHPILWALLIWGLAHIPPNGDLVSVVLFGGMAVFSLAGIPLLDAMARRRLGAERWGALAKATSVLPFAALLSGRTSLGPITPHLVSALAGLALYAWFVLRGHELLIGVDPLALLRPPG